MMKMGKKMSPAEAKAKLSSLKDLMKDMDNLMLDDMKNAKGKKGMAKVTVQASSPEAAEKALESAEEAVEGSQEKGDFPMTLPKFGSKQEPGSQMDEESYEADSEEDSDEDSEEDLDKLIAELMAKKKAKESKMS